MPLRFYILFTLFLSASLLTTAQQSEPFIIVGESLRPFEFVAEGEPKGINVELTRLVMNDLDIPVEFRIDNEVRAMDLARQGKADAILSVSYKPSRESFLIYPENFQNRENAENFMWVSEYVCFVRKADTEIIDCSSFEAIAESGLTVGAVEGVSYNSDYWEAKMDVRKYPDNQAVYRALSDGNIDIFINDKVIGRFAVNELDLSDQVTALNTILIDKLYTMAFVRKSDYPNKESLMNQFYERFRVLKVKGVAKEIYLKYLFKR